MLIKINITWIEATNTHKTRLVILFIRTIIILNNILYITLYTNLYSNKCHFLFISNSKKLYTKLSFEYFYK